MSLYNTLFGMNPQSDLLLAVLGLRANDIERFRDVSASAEGTEITIYSRTGGGNREDYPNLTMRKLPTWRGSVDDDFDSTYCTDTFSVPTQFVEDVKGLGDIFSNGMRPVFGQHMLKALHREPTEDDKAAAAYEKEAEQLARTAHFKANGHTFVPLNDAAMETALKLAESNGGELRSTLGIMPIVLTIQTNYHPYPNAKSESDRAYMIRAEVGYDHRWGIDVPYWEHCQKRFADQYPMAMAKVAEGVRRHLHDAC